MRMLALCFLAMAMAAQAGPVRDRDGWAVHHTGLTYQETLKAVPVAVKAAGLAVVTQAGPTAAAKRRGIDIPGNRVFGVYNNDFAVRVLALSTAAMIEAPIRVYVTEEEDGTATFSYKRPSYVFAPYMNEAGSELEVIAAELDAKFDAIAARLVQGN